MKNLKRNIGWAWILLVSVITVPLLSINLGIDIVRQYGLGALLATMGAVALGASMVVAILLIYSDQE